MGKVVLAEVLSKDVENLFPADSEKLFNYLEADTKYADWIVRRIEQYGFTENQDYSIELVKTKGRPKKLYWVTLDMVKELSMVENNEKGREARKYFIQIEKEYRDALNAPIRTSNVTILDVRRELTTAKLRLTLEKKKHRATAEFYEAKIKFLTTQPQDKNLESENIMLRRENKNLKNVLINFSNRYHSVVLEADDKVQAIKGELMKMTNSFQTLPNLVNDGNNLNTETVAKHSYW